jgi:hypothetical protein
MNVNDPRSAQAVQWCLDLIRFYATYGKKLKIYKDSKYREMLKIVNDFINSKPIESNPSKTQSKVPKTQLADEYILAQDILAQEEKNIPHFKQGGNVRKFQTGGAYLYKQSQSNKPSEIE